MIELRVVSTDADYQSWAAITTAVIPREPVTAAQLRDAAVDGRLIVIASFDGTDAACAVGNNSGFAGRSFFGVRVLPQFRGRGVGRELTRVLCERARALGHEGVNAFVDASEPDSYAVAEHYGLRQVDYQLHQERAIGAEPPPPAGPVSLEGRREEMLRAVWPLAQEAYADLPLPEAIDYRVELWLKEEATAPGGSFVVYDGDEIVGYAGLMEHAEPGVAEHGLTAVARSHRGRGIGRALKLAQLHWASQNGIDTLVTWTQEGNEAMQALNHSLGYRNVSKVLTMQGPLPL